MSRPRYRHIIWDWNGTLLNDVEACIGVLNDLLNHRGLSPLSLDQYHATFDFPVRAFYETLGFDFTRESYDRVAEDYISGYLEQLNHCPLQLGARSLLQAIQHAGLTQSVLSAYHHRLLDEAVTAFGLKDYFIGLVGLDDYAAHGKVETGRAWINQLPYDRAEVFLVGDTRHDYEVAREMGIDCGLITNGHLPRYRLDDLPVPLFEGFSAIAAFLGIVTNDQPSS